MIVDLHSHTWYSGCGKDNPEDLVKKMIDSGVNVFGVTDHCHGVGNRKREYFDVLSNLKEKYKSQITIYRGIEISADPRFFPKEDEDFSYFDYCIVEHFDKPDYMLHGDIIPFAKRMKIPTGIAHTDIFSYCKVYGINEKKLFQTLADNGIFWEMNVSYDSIHFYNEHQYVKDFIADKSQQELIKKVGLKISVGFDGHRMDEYKVDRVKSECEFLEQNGFNLIKGF